VAAALALAVGAGGCGASLANGVDRSYGFTGAVVSSSSDLSAKDVPLSGHQVSVGGKALDARVSGELIAASEAELVIDTRPEGGWRRVKIADVDWISIELYPSYAWLTAAVTVGAMGLGFYGLSHASDMSHGANEFFGGWGLVWLPLGLFVALPTAIGVGLSNDHDVHRGSPEFDALVERLATFARYPQGEPGHATPTPYEPPTRAAPPSPSAAPPPRPTPPPEPPVSPAPAF
jgi:hypothetical protein